LRNSSTRKEDKEEDISRTPTKRVKYGTVRGVDLSTIEVEEGASARKRRKEDTSAFMALKPDRNAQRVVEEVGRGDELPEEEKEYLLSIREKRRTRPAGSRSGLKRKDWTFKEGVWGSESVQNKNQAILEKVSPCLHVVEGLLMDRYLTSCLDTLKVEVCRQWERRGIRV